MQTSFILRVLPAILREPHSLGHKAGLTSTVLDTVNDGSRDGPLTQPVPLEGFSYWSWQEAIFSFRPQILELLVAMGKEVYTFVWTKELFWVQLFLSQVRWRHFYSVFSLLLAILRINVHGFRMARKTRCSGCWPPCWSSFLPFSSHQWCSTHPGFPGVSPTQRTHSFLRNVVLAGLSVSYVLPLCSHGSLHTFTKCLLDRETFSAYPITKGLSCHSPLVPSALMFPGHSIMPSIIQGFCLQTTSILTNGQPTSCKVHNYHTCHQISSAQNNVLHIVGTQ